MIARQPFDSIKSGKVLDRLLKRKTLKKGEKRGRVIALTDSVCCAK